MKNKSLLKRGRNIWKSAAMAMLTAISQGAFAQVSIETPVMVKNINTHFTANPGIRPLARVKGNFFFLAYTVATGWELWKSDGTEGGTGLLKDINPGVGNAFDPTYLPTVASVNDTLFFSANDGKSGIELWKTDGTTAGTLRVKDIEPGPASSSFGEAVGMDGSLFFFVSGAATTSLWKSNGTGDGAIKIQQWPSFVGPTSTEFYGLTAVAGNLFFVVRNDSVNGQELWKSDGTEAGTVAIKEYFVPPGPFSSIGNTFLFISFYGNELWRSDGTTVGTVQVKGFNLGRVAGPRTDVDGILFFTVLDQTWGGGLWRTDGTVAGTFQVGRTIQSGNTFKLGGNLLFWADEGDGYGGHLWKSDGTIAGTLRITRLPIPPLGSPGPVHEAILGDAALFSFSHQLWKTDGTAVGTVLVKDTVDVTSVAVVNGNLVFVASRGPQESPSLELWKSDGTAAGTLQLKDQLSHGGAEWESADPFFFPMDDYVFFAIEDEQHTSFALWKTDGTQSGTVMVKRLESGIINQGSNISVAGQFNGQVIFLADDDSEGPNELKGWLSDGTEAGTVPAGFFPWYGEGVEVNGTYFFTQYDEYGYQLWKSDGTAAGTRRVIDHPNGSESPGYLTSFEGELFFIFANGLWKTDGSEAGTVKVKDLTDLYVAALGTFKESLVFWTSGGDLAFWKSDGTESGTAVVKRFGNPSNPSTITWNASGETLFFATSEQLWKSDGTEAGTVAVKDVAGVFKMISVNGKLFINTYVETRGAGFWTSDGTQDGTVRIGEFNAASMTKFNGLLFYLQPGSGLWKTDGTQAGTVRVKEVELASGPRSGYSPIVVANDALFFVDWSQRLWQSDGTEFGTILVPTRGQLAVFPFNLATVNNFSSSLLMMASTDRNYGSIETWTRTTMACPIGGKTNFSRAIPVLKKILTMTA